MSHFHVTEIGAGNVTRDGTGYHLHVPAQSAAAYHDAQITTYDDHHDFAQSPPLTMRVRAYAPQPIRGTAGFGFWNHPFAPNERRLRLPRAAWFFYGSPPNDMPLAKDVPGHGWKCATIDATRAAFLALVPLALPGFLLMRVPALYRRLWPVGQAALGVSEHALDESLLATSHEYALHWSPDGVRFDVDGATIHHAPVRLRGPLGFIAWIDNQYAVVTPQGRFRFGLVDVPAAQSLMIESITLDS